MDDVLARAFPGEHDEDEGYIFEQHGMVALWRYRNRMKGDTSPPHSEADRAIDAYIQQQAILAIGQAT